MFFKALFFKASQHVNIEAHIFLTVLFFRLHNM